VRWLASVLLATGASAAPLSRSTAALAGAGDGQHLRAPQHMPHEEIEQSHGLGAELVGFLQKQQPGIDPMVVTAPPATKGTPVSGLMFYVLAIISTLFAAFVTAIIAFFYRERREAKAGKPGPYQSIGDFQHFKTGPFDIFDDLPLFSFTLQCPCIRWADTLGSVHTRDPNESKQPILSFWVAFCVLFLLYHFCHLTGQSSAGICFWLFTAGVSTFFRYKLRKAFDMKNDAETACKDCLLYTCCCCFAMAQEARHVEEARKLQHPAVLQ